MEGDKRQERRHFLARHGTPSRLQRCGNTASGWWAGRVQDQPRALSPRTTPRTARQPSFGLLAAAGQSAASVPNIVGWGFHCWLGGIASTELGVGDLHSTTVGGLVWKSPGVYTNKQLTRVVSSTAGGVQVLV